MSQNIQLRLEKHTMRGLTRFTIHQMWFLLLGHSPTNKNLLGICFPLTFSEFWTSGQTYLLYIFRWRGTAGQLQPCFTDSKFTDMYFNVHELLMFWCCHSIPSLMCSITASQNPILPYIQKLVVFDNTYKLWKTFSISVWLTSANFTFNIS